MCHERWEQRQFGTVPQDEHAQGLGVDLRCDELEFRQSDELEVLQRLGVCVAVHVREAREVLEREGFGVHEVAWAVDAVAAGDDEALGLVSAEGIGVP